MTPSIRRVAAASECRLSRVLAAATPPAAVEYYSGPDLPPPLLRQTVDLVRRTMGPFAGSRGVDVRRKREDMRHPDTRVIAVRAAASAALLGFASYQLTVEEGVPVAYLLELHLEPFARGMSLGSELVRDVERLGREGGAGGVMLTVHASNEAAKRFYTSAMRFEVSPISPSQCAPPSMAGSCDYEVMQKLWDESARRTLRKRGAAARRALYVEAMDEGRLAVKLVMRKRGRNGFPDRDEDDGACSDATQGRGD